MASKPTRAPGAPSAPVVSVASAPPCSRVSVLRHRDAQLQARADVIRRELMPSLGDRGMALTDWELDAFSLAVASGSVLGRDTVLRLAALRMHLEEVALGDPDAVDDLISEEGHGPEPVF
jgi:hypothetical protein